MSKIIKPINFLFLFVVLNLIIGILIVPDFGRSTDESPEGKRANLALRVYTGELNQDLKTAYDDLGHYQNYGTASTALIQFFERFLFPGTDHSQKIVAHYFYFLFFQAAVVAIFFLGTYFFDSWISLGIAILFGTQPLLFGHAFINPKDIPLLSTFLWSVVTGFIMVDRWLQNDHLINKNASESTPEKASSTKRTKKQWVFILIVALLFLVLWSKNWITDLILQGVEYSYNSQGSGLLGNLFSALTTSGSLEGYITLTQSYILQIYRWISFGTPLFLLLIYLYAKRNHLFSGNINLYVLLSAAIWGCSISTRVLGIAAGGIVGLYALVKLKQKAIIPLAIYTITASIVSYITWPFLWAYGMRGYLDSLNLFSDFYWTGQVLFEGQLFEPTDLPSRYLPKLMLLQFTEPLVVLIIVGFFISLFMLYKKKTDTTRMLLLYGWFFTPLLFTMISGATVYSNFRHFLFTTPPLFIFAGLSLQLVASLMKKNAWILVLFILIIIPSIVSIIQIHPYEYIYYNSFTGGIEGAYQKYDLDYWNVAYKDAVDYVNENIPPGSKILVWKDNMLGEVYAEKDFTFSAHTSVSEQEYTEYDYAIMPVGKYNDIPILKNSKELFTVEIENAKLLIVLQITNDNS